MRRRFRLQAHVGRWRRSRWVQTTAVGGTLEKKGDGPVEKEGQPTWTRLYALLGPEKKQIAYGMGAMAVSTGATLMIPLGFGRMIDAAAVVLESPGMTNTADLQYLGGGLAGILCISAVASAVRSYYFTVAGAQLVTRLRSLMYKSILDKNIPYFDSTSTGQLLSRIGVDVEVLSKSLSGANLSQGVRSLLQGFGCLGIMASVSPKLMLVMGGVIPSIAGVSYIYGCFIRKLQQDIQDAQSNASHVADECLGGIKTVKAFATEKTELGKYTAKLHDAFEIMKRSATGTSAYFGVTQFVGNASLLAVLAYGTHLTILREITPGDLTSFVMYAVYTGMSIISLSSVYSDVNRGLGASTHVLKLLEQGQVTALEKETSPVETVQGSITLQNVDFAYPDRPDTAVFRNMSLEIQAGQVLGLVGGSGSGKSSLAALLLRFYDAQGGSILIDGHPIASFSPSFLRKNIGIVSQEPILFSGSIADNIRYSDTTASMDRIRVCAVQAHADEFIQSFPQGYDTVLTERGSGLSGGQRQRIAIARALLKDPKILILDEATAALDAESEQRVQEALEILMRNRTTIVIAHRLSTVQNTDRIAVLKHGRIAECDSPVNLLRDPDSQYAMLMKLQTTGLL